MKRYTLVVLMLCFAFVLVTWGEYGRPVLHDNAASLTNALPLSMGTWQGRDLIVREQVKQILETENILMRRYRSDEGKEVLLTIVYYRNGRVAFHMPESCTSGQGASVIGRRYELLKLKHGGEVPLVTFVTQGNKGESDVKYFYLAGGIKTGSYALLRFAMIRNALTKGSTDCAMIKVSGRGKDVLDAFLQELCTHLPSSWQ